ncbi:MAG: 16S rRNA (cytosine(1402)-N(4))-methyltransferase, partial [Thermoanaerobaculia bacterium]
MKHEPVLLQEVIELLRPARPDGILVDATVGLGGHAEALLESYPAVRLVGG